MYVVPETCEEIEMFVGDPEQMVVSEGVMVRSGKGFTLMLKLVAFPMHEAREGVTA